MKRQRKERFKARKTANVTALGKHFRWSGTVLVAMGMVLSLVQVGLPEELLSVGDCTPGEARCLVNQVAVCACYEEWRETPDGEIRTFTVCTWEYHGERSTSRLYAESSRSRGQVRWRRCQDL